MDQFSTCYKCNFETVELLPLCPQCGGRLRTSTQVRRLGWVLAALGAFLTIFMGLITLVVAGIMSNSGGPASSSHYTGTPQQAELIFGLFGAVIAFGLTALTGGVWQIRYGKRNKKLVFLLFGLAVVLAILGAIVGGETAQVERPVQPIAMRAGYCCPRDFAASESRNS